VRLSSCQKWTVIGSSSVLKLDANSGFWQILLDEESYLLTMFITLYGRYAFNKLLFGISSAPEVLQRRMSRILEGLEGVVCQIDDILVFGKDQKSTIDDYTRCLSDWSLPMSHVSSEKAL